MVTFVDRVDDLTGDLSLGGIIADFDVSGCDSADDIRISEVVALLVEEDDSILIHFGVGDEFA